MRQWDPAVRARGQRRRDPRHNLERDARFAQCLQLLRTTREQKWVAPFQAHDSLACARQRHELRIDRHLHGAVLTVALAHVALLGVRTCVEQRGVRQRVVQNGIRA